MALNCYYWPTFELFTVSCSNWSFWISNIYSTVYPNGERCITILPHHASGQHNRCDIGAVNDGKVEWNGKFLIVMTLVAFGISSLWGSLLSAVVTFGGKNVYIGRTELFLRNKRTKFVKPVLETWNTILRCSLNLCYCHIGRVIHVYTALSVVSRKASKIKILYCSTFSVRKARVAYLIERGQSLVPHGLKKKDET